MTPEQFDALERMIRGIISAESTEAHNSSDGGLIESIAATEAIADARKLLVDEPAKEIVAESHDDFCLCPECSKRDV